MSRRRGRRPLAALLALLGGCAGPLHDPIPVDPGEGADPILRLAAAHALDARGYTRSALGVVDAVLVSRPDDPDALREKARLHERLSEEHAAIAALERLLGIQPDDLDALFRAGCARARTGESDAAVELLERYVRRIPDDPSGRRALGYALYERSRGGGSEADAARALEEYRAARTLAPGIAEVHHDLAFLLAERGDASEAEAEYRAALECDPDHLASLEGLASLLAEGKRWQEAAPLARAAIERERDPRRRDRLEEILSAIGPSGGGRR